jgi:hypothetical protein
MLVEIGHVSGEGGPLLLVDWKTAPGWRGVENGGKDYERVCALLNEEPRVEGRVVTVGSGSGLVWEMEGGGTAEVFRRGSQYAVVSRTWLEDPDDLEASRMLAEAPVRDGIQIGELTIPSGVLAVLWAPEDGRAFESLDPEGLPTGDMSMGGTGLTLQLEPGVYDCFHDSVTNGAGDARRCHLVRRCA